IAGHSAVPGSVVAVPGSASGPTVQASNADAGMKGGLAMVARMPAVAPAVRRDALLRRALAGNALFSAVSGVAAILGSGPIGHFTGLTPAWLPAVIGGGVLAWALAVSRLARSDELRPGPVRMVIAGDLTWIVASYAILAVGAPEFTTGGAWAVAILAEIV